MVTVPAWAVPPPSQWVTWAWLQKNGKFLAGANIWCGGRLRPLGSPAVVWEVLQCRSRLSGLLRCCRPEPGREKSPWTSLCWVLGGCASPPAPRPPRACPATAPLCFGKPAHNPAGVFSNGTDLSDGELCRWRCKPRSALGCLASLPAVLSVLENCTALAPRETFKRVIPLLFSLIKVTVPRPSVELRP